MVICIPSRRCSELLFEAAREYVDNYCSRANRLAQSKYSTDTTFFRYLLAQNEEYKRVSFIVKIEMIDDQAAKDYGAVVICHPEFVATIETCLHQDNLTEILLNLEGCDLYVRISHGRVRRLRGKQISSQITLGQDLSPGFMWDWLQQTYCNKSKSNILQIQNGKDAYSGQPLSITNATLDHICPKAHFKNLIVNFRPPGPSPKRTQWVPHMGLISQGQDPRNLVVMDQKSNNNFKKHKIIMTYLESMVDQDVKQAAGSSHPVIVRYAKEVLWQRGLINLIAPGKWIPRVVCGNKYLSQEQVLGMVGSLRERVPVIGNCMYRNETDKWYYPYNL